MLAGSPRWIPTAGVGLLGAVSAFPAQTELRASTDTALGALWHPAAAERQKTNLSPAGEQQHLPHHAGTNLLLLRHADFREEIKQII